MDLSAWAHRDRAALVSAIVLPLAVAALLVPFRTNLPNTDAALVLVVTVVAVAANGNRVAGILAAASAAVWFDFFLTAPYEHFTITHRADIETTILLLVVGAAVTEIAVRGRRQRIIAVTEAAYLEAIGSTTEMVSNDEQPAVIINHVKEQLTALLGMTDCRFESFSVGGLPRIQQDGRLRWHQQYWDVEGLGLPLEPIELTATCNGGTYGRFVLTAVPGSVPAMAGRQVAYILANQVGAAISHQSRAL